MMHVHMCMHGGAYISGDRNVVLRDTSAVYVCRNSELLRLSNSSKAAACWQREGKVNYVWDFVATQPPETCDVLGSDQHVPI